MSCTAEQGSAKKTAGEGTSARSVKKTVEDWDQDQRGSARLEDVVQQRLVLLQPNTVEESAASLGMAQRRPVLLHPPRSGEAAAVLQLDNTAANACCLGNPRRVRPDLSPLLRRRARDQEAHSRALSGELNL